MDSSTEGPQFDVHVFARDDTFLAFDCRNFTILRLDPLAAYVLSGIRTLSLDEIARPLDGAVSADLLNAHYERFLELARMGVLSSAPVGHCRRPPFYRLVVMLAGGCNMACRYCFERDVPVTGRANLMSHETAERVLDWFFTHHEGDRAHIQLYGGEPLLNWPVLQAVVDKAERWAEELDIRLTKYLITNGTLLAADRAAYLAAHRVTVQVSVDGAAEFHDRFRVLKNGQPSLPLIEPNITLLSKLGADFNLRAVLTRENRSPRAIIESLRSLGGTRVSFEVVATDDASCRLTTDDWRALTDEYQAMLRDPFTTWGSLAEELQALIVRICERKRLHHGCGAGTAEVTVDPAGNVYDCQRLYQAPRFNVSDCRSPVAIGTDIAGVEDRPACAECWARFLCGGGCAHLFTMGGGTIDPLPEFCAMKRCLAEEAIAKISEIRRAAGASRQSES